MAAKKRRKKRASKKKAPRKKAKRKYTKRRKTTAARKKTSRKRPTIRSMPLKMLTTKRNAIDAEIRRRHSRVGVTKSKRRPAEQYQPTRAQMED